MRTLLVTLALVLASAAPAAATTWGPTEVTCPLCAEANTFEKPMSWGSYVYRWPSKFQLVFWPSTEGRSLWSCGGCKLTMFMWDWEEKVKPEHHEKLRAALKDVTLPAPPAEGGYRKLPMLERLTVAEKVYEVVGLDDDTWCRFFRVVGYHAAKGGDAERARAARGRALERVTKLIEAAQGKGAAKELQVIAAGLQRLLGDAAAARKHLDAAAALALEDADPKKAQDRNAYFDQLIGELRAKLDANDLADDAPDKRADEGH